MRKTLTAALAAVTFGGAIVATAAPAAAAPHRYYGGRHDDHGDAVAAGVIGLALGAALASGSSHPRYYSERPYYGPGYADPYYSGYRYRTCVRDRWVWDPYVHRRVVVRERFAC